VHVQPSVGLTNLEHLAVHGIFVVIEKRRDTRLVINASTRSIGERKRGGQNERETLIVTHGVDLCVDVDHKLSIGSITMAVKPSHYSEEALERRVFGSEDFKPRFRR